LNILFVSEPLFPTPGSLDGTASRTLNLARALERRGHNVYVLTLRESPDAPLEEFYDKCRIIRFEKGVYPLKFYRQRRKVYLGFVLKGKIFPFYAKIMKLISTHSIDILYCSNYLPSLTGIVFRKFIRVPIVCDLQTSLFPEAWLRGDYIESIIGRMIEKMVFDFADAVTVPVPEYKEYASKIYGQSVERCYVVPSCVDIHQFSPHTSAKNRGNLGLPLKDYLVFFHGTPYPENFRALEKLIQIVRELNKRGLPTKALVAGDFESNVSNIQDIIFTGWISQEDLARYINIADMAVLPIQWFSVCKGICTRIVEYLASGKAVVTTKDGATGLGFAVEEGGLIAVDTLEEMIDAIVSLLKDNSLRDSIGRNARMVTEKYLSPKSIGILLESVFKKTLNKQTRTE